MFNKKLKRSVESLSTRIDYLNDESREKYWALRSDLDRLVEALGMTKQETHRVEYVKKGGPEAPP